MATTRYGLLGYPARHSKSPAMHNAAFKQAGIDAQYDAYEVAPNLLQVVFNIFVGILLIAIIIVFGIIVDEDYLQKWR